MEKWILDFRLSSGPAGIEPTTSDSESDIIPLNYGPITITCCKGNSIIPKYLQKKSILYILRKLYIKIHIWI